MVFFFFLLLLFVLYPYIIYPSILWLFSLFRGKSVEKKDHFPPVSLIISAYNEERVIREKMDNSLELDYPRDRLEIIVASESIDGTNAIVESYGEKGVILYAYPTREGKAATLYKVVPKAKGEIIVFSDANAIYEPDALKKLTRCFSDRRIGCVSGRLRYVNPSGTKIGTNEGLYWRYEMFIKKLESRLLSLLGANGSIFAVRKDLYFPMSPDRGDDFELPVMAALEGHGVVLEPEAVSKERSSDEFASEFRRKVRIISWNSRSAFLLLGRALKKKKYFIIFQLLSHKIFRWMTILFLLGLLGVSFFLPQPVFRVLLALQLFFYCLAGMGYLFEKIRRHVPAVLAVPFYFCMINWASMVGMANSLFKKHDATWEKVRS